MTITEVTFNTGTFEQKATVVHNFDEYGFDIHKAVKAWKSRSVNQTVQMFCRYIRNRNTAFICMPLEEAIKVSNHLNNI